MVTPRAFVSYSHDSSEHKKWVLDLAWILRAEYGIDVMLDTWDVGLGGDLPRFMEGIAHSDKVLLICTEAYVKKCDETTSGGVAYEKMLVTPKIVADVAAEIIIPIIKNNPEAKRPVFLQGKRFIDFRDDTSFEICVRELAAAIHGIETKPPIGRNPFRKGLDANFGNKGRCLIDANRLTPLRFKCADNDIKVVGRIDDDLVIAGVQNNGDPDMSLGGNGVVRIDSARLAIPIGDALPSANGVIVVPRQDLAGAPLAARKVSWKGEIEDYRPDLRFDALLADTVSATFRYSRNELAVQCINADGTPSAVGNAGHVKMAVPDGFPLDWMRAKIIGQGIFLFGRTNFPRDERALIYRFLFNGQIDTNFGDGGVADLTKLVWFNGISDIAQMLDGRLIVGGHGNEANLVCLTENGRADPSFGNGGIVEFRASARSTCQRVACVGHSIVFAGEASDGRSRNDVYVAKLTPDGHPIQTFHGDGFLSFGIKNNDLVVDLATSERTAIVLCYSDKDAPNHFRTGLARLHI